MKFLKTREIQNRMNQSRWMGNSWPIDTIDGFFAGLTERWLNIFTEYQNEVSQLEVHTVSVGRDERTFAYVAS
jgi:hypothetical protein